MTPTVHADLPDVPDMSATAPSFRERRWELSPSVALRPEPFGALAYDFDTRQLSFLKTPRLVHVVRLLAQSPDAGSALREAGVDGPSVSAYLAALEGLADTGIIRERAA